MTKEVLLVLGIFEGRGWNPVNGHKAVIEAHLDSHKLTTGSFPLTNSPKFNTEITWEAEKQTIRRYKINRVPIKIECYSLDDKNNRKSLGYIVLPLTSAVEGVEADSKWHRVLGGPNAKFKNPPSILLRLHLEALGSNKPNQVACTPMTTFRNGQQAALEGIKMSFLQEKRSRLAPPQQQHRRDEVEVTRVSQTNGNAKGASRPDGISHLLQGMNGVYTPKAHMDPDEMDEDMLDYDSEEEYDDDEDEGEDEGDIPKERGPSAGTGPLRLEGGEVEAPLENGDAEMKDASLASGDASGQRDVSDHEALLKTRSDARELLRSISQTLRPSWQGGDSPRPGVSSATPKSSSLTRRTRDISALLQDSLESMGKARKEEENGAPEAFSERLLASTERPKDSLEESRFRARLAHSPATTSAAFLLSQSLGDTEKARPSPDPDRNRAQTRLAAHLNTEEGYFSIGPQPGELEEQFNFSITIVYAKNLTKVIPEDVLSGLRGDYRFCYSLLGHSIHTDPFTDLNNPEFLAEKATAVIRSSHQTLSLYFTQHYFLPVHFLSEETCLGVSTIDILPLIEIATRDEAQVDGVYELEPAEGATPRALQSDCKAVVAVSVQLSKTKSSAPALTQAPEQDRAYNEIFLSDSMSSSSDEMDVFRVRSKRSKMAVSGRPCVRCRSQGVKAGREMERKKKALLHEAAYEVERWKEEQKKYYLKEWASKEETLQRLIAAEWSSKVKAIEGELSERLGECDKLQEKLNSALGELSVREEKIKVRERKVIEFEQELNCEKEKMMQSSGKLKESRSEKDPKHAQSQNLTKQFEAERKRRLELETEISKLQEELQISEQTVNAQAEEVFGLRRKLIQSDDIIGTGKEKDILLSKIESLQERKQYYKAQWLSAITDLHKLHSAHKNIIDEISCNDRRTNQDDLPNPSSAGNKLRKLKDERKVLLESGLYPLNHSIIKRIDKKIKDLVG